MGAAGRSGQPASLTAKGGAPLAETRADSCVAIVLAAGLGKRMRSALPKVLHPVAGRPMLGRVLAALAAAGVRRAVVVVGNGADAVRAAAERGELSATAIDVVFADQPAPRGTGDAARCGLAAVPVGTGRVLVVPGDTPLLAAEDLARLLTADAAAGALLTTNLADPSGYGRVVRDAAGSVRAIVEERDASPGERAVQEINAGVYAFRRDLLEGALARCRADNAQGELYLTDVVGILHDDGQPVVAVPVADAATVMGVNDRVALAAAEAILRRRILERWMRAGVTVVDPASTYIDEAVEIGPDTVIAPQSILAGPCRIAGGCTIGPGAHLIASDLGPGCNVRHSVVEFSRLGAACSVGPFAHLRAGTELGARVQVGNFAELKGARVGDDVKQHHHSYLGDAELGPGVNVGAGVITVNFDGRAKHRTVVGAGAFLGCNANLVAPVEVGAGAFVAAGTTVTRAVPADALVVARPAQVIKEGWARRRLAAAPEDGGSTRA